MCRMPFRLNWVIYRIYRRFWSGSSTGLSQNHSLCLHWTCSTSVNLLTTNQSTPTSSPRQPITTEHFGKRKWLNTVVTIHPMTAETCQQISGAILQYLETVPPLNAIKIQKLKCSMAVTSQKLSELAQGCNSNTVTQPLESSLLITLTSALPCRKCSDAINWLSQRENELQLVACRQADYCYILSTPTIN